MNLRIVSASALLHVGLVSAVAAWAGVTMHGRSGPPPTLVFAPSEPVQPLAETPPRSETFEVEWHAPPVPNPPPAPAEPLADLEEPKPFARLHHRPPIDPLRDLEPRVRLRPAVQPEIPPTPRPQPQVQPPEPAPPATSFVAARALKSVNREPVYPRQAILHGWTGSVVVHLSIDASGLVTDARIVRPCAHPALNRAALRAARTWRFEPARRNGRPVSSAKDIPIDFELIER